MEQSDTQMRQPQEMATSKPTESQNRFQGKVVIVTGGGPWHRSLPD